MDLKRIGLIIAALCALALGVNADTTTTRANLIKPDVGSTGWGPKLNSNWDVVDSSVAFLSTFQTFTGLNWFNNSVAMRGGNALSFNSIGNGAQAQLYNSSAGSGWLKLDGNLGINTSPSSSIDLTALTMSVSTITVSSATFTAVVGSTVSAINSFFVVDGASITSTSSSPLYISASQNNASMRINGDSTIIGNRYVHLSPAELTLNQNVVGPALFPSFNFCNGATSCASIYGTPSYTSPPLGLYFMAAPNASVIPLTVTASTVTVGVGLIASSITASGFTQFAFRTLATLKVLTPGATFQAYGCTDCATDAVCVSTGVGRGAFARVSARSTVCQ